MESKSCAENRSDQIVTGAGQVYIAKILCLRKTALWERVKLHKETISSKICVAQRYKFAANSPNQFFLFAILCAYQGSCFVQVIVATTSGVAESNPTVWDARVWHENETRAALLEMSSAVQHPGGTAPLSTPLVKQEPRYTQRNGPQENQYYEIIGKKMFKPMNTQKVIITGVDLQVSNKSKFSIYSFTVVSTSYW